MIGDLHLHSYYSDGFYSPSEVMRKAKAAGAQVTALTDHDTLAGVAEATRAATALGMKNIAGVEISTFTGGLEAHILGYGICAQNRDFCEFISGQKQKRHVRSAKLLENLAAHGMVFPPDTFASDVDREISRSHIAAAMVRLGMEADFHEAIRKWLHRGAPTFVPMEGATPEEAIRQIHAAGGLAVLAHPVRLDLDPYERATFIRALAAAGLDGIEATYKRSSHAVVKALKSLARELGLFTTAGADFHGDGNEIIVRMQPAALTQRV